jgi:dihydroorotate dehydrogenase (fumarate)
MSKDGRPGIVQPGTGPKVALDGRRPPEERTMADLSTTYLGIPLANPVTVAACSISSRLEQVQLAERFGASAVVMRSLFEEQILADRAAMEEVLSVGGGSHAEAQDYFPPLRHAGADEYLRRLEETCRGVSLPVIGSLNAVQGGSWVSYARRLGSTGIKALELNIYAVATDPTRSGADIEAELLELVAEVVRAVGLPVAVKISPYYSSVVHLCDQIIKRGASGVVLFNRFLQPDIDPQRETLTHDMSLSTPAELRLPLRYTALLHGRIAGDLAVTSGVHSGLDVARALLAGATITQSAAALLKNGLHHLSDMLRDLETWLDEHGYESVDSARGRLSAKQVADPFAFERAQYVGLLMAGSGLSPLNTRVG